MRKFQVREWHDLTHCLERSLWLLHREKTVGMVGKMELKWSSALAAPGMSYKAKLHQHEWRAAQAFLFLVLFLCKTFKDST